MSEHLSEEQERVIIMLLNPEYETAYDCQTTMRTMNALLYRDLVKRTNYGEVVWFGWERTGCKFMLTQSGRTLAICLKEESEKVKKT